MQHVQRRARPAFPDALVDPHLPPSFEHFGLVLGQVRLHGELRLRQIQGGLKFKQGRRSPRVSPLDYIGRQWRCRALAPAFGRKVRR